MASLGEDAAGSSQMPPLPASQVIHDANAEGTGSPPRSRPRVSKSDTVTPSPRLASALTPRRSTSRNGNYHPPLSSFEPYNPIQIPTHLKDFAFSGSPTGSSASSVFQFGGPHRPASPAGMQLDPLLYADMSFLDERTPMPPDQVQKKQMALLQQILIRESPFRPVCTEQRQPTEFSWALLVKHLTAFRPDFDPHSNILFASLLHRGQLLGCGYLGNNGEFTRTIGHMLALVRDKVVDEKESFRVEVCFAMRRGCADTDEYAYFAPCTPDAPDAPDAAEGGRVASPVIPHDVVTDANDG
ncbi:hypothetical protein CSUB01_12627 [Colletotrichum sublineola]|uniref:Uncharacterized protein n=1 Tax=Colletotrichum sublineola TaxID=1173701 RepID=A0A066XXL1_COLSU|nr:hypothetical protein CSUB01_12627 [Colletotrichum sublineola]